MGNMRFKVGDRVRIKSLDWYNENKDEHHNVVFANGWHFSEPMSAFCGEELIIEGFSYATNPPHYMMKDNMFAWTDEMIEELVEEENESDPKFIVGDIVYSKTWQRNVVIMEILPDGFYKVGEYGTGWFKEHEDNLYKEKITLPRDSHSTELFKHGISLPEGYQFIDDSGNVINTTKIVLEKKKKKEYPKTYEECYKIMGVKLSDCYIQGYKSPLLEDLQQLLICRDAYWKIAGEEMGLGKPWEPDWTNQESPKYCVASVEGQVKAAERYIINTNLAFPTEEMRDAFKENFKSEIEFCKELL